MYHCDTEIYEEIPIIYESGILQISNGCYV